jgi:predicted acylesterase/phospholipase RssA
MLGVQSSKPSCIPDYLACEETIARSANEDVETQHSSEPSPKSKSRGSSQAGPSRLSTTAKDRVKALAERKRALREAKEKSTRIRDNFIADDYDSSEFDDIPAPRQKRRPAVAEKGSRIQRRSKQEASDEETSRRRNVKSLRRQARKIRDPDEGADGTASEAEDMVKEVELDEADRCKLV